MKKYTILTPEDAIMGKTNYFYAKNDQHARHILRKSEFSKLTTIGINFNLYKVTPYTKIEKIVWFKENYLQKHGLKKLPRKVKKKNKKYGIPFEPSLFFARGSARFNGDPHDIIPPALMKTLIRNDFEIPFKLNKYGYHIDWNLKK